MSLLEKRLLALENAVAPTGVVVIIRRIVSPGGLDAPARFAKVGDLTVERNEGEEESAFLERATKQARDSYPEKVRPRILIMSELDEHL